MKLTDQEKELLLAMKESKRYPIARFELHSSKEPTFRSIVLNHVKITEPGDSMELVKARGALLADLARRGIIHLCYTLRVTARSDFEIYYQSDIYRILCQMAEEGRQQPGFLLDTPYIRRGVATITPLGRKVLLENL